MRDVFLSVRVGSLIIKSYIMNRPLLSGLTSCGTASYAHGIQYRLSVRVSLLRSPGIEQLFPGIQQLGEFCQKGVQLNLDVEC